MVPFLNMTKQFNPISQISKQINAIVMALAGAARIFELLDESPRPTRAMSRWSTPRTKTARHARGGRPAHRPVGMEASAPRRHGHLPQAAGDITFTDVDFGYEPDKNRPARHHPVCRPGQKIAFVGSTGAGKTTITNLINRFYDIADGKIRYDGININKIRRPTCAASLGIVLQDMNLFTGTVMDNIRYGNLDATTRSASRPPSSPTPTTSSPACPMATTPC